jgi:hypothetical protein
MKQAHGLNNFLKATSRSFYLIPYCGTRATGGRAPANRRAFSPLVFFLKAFNFQA